MGSAGPLAEPEPHITCKEGQVEAAPEQVEDAECQERERQKLASLATGGKLFPHFAAVYLQSRFNALIKGEEEQVFSQPSGETSEL